jgi:GNAT superfamily N-acetyltransferase
MELEISTDPDRLDIDLIHRFLSEEAYWSPGVSREIVERSLANSLCFGAYLDAQQVGLARVITDRTTFAYLSDVFILAPYRGRGYGKRLLQTIFEHPDMQGLRRFTLATRDAHSLYAQFGFQPLPHPERFMMRKEEDSAASSA